MAIGNKLLIIFANINTQEFQEFNDDKTGGQH
jgi:hypothetical protein